MLYINNIFSETVRERNNPNAKLKTVSMETKEILAELERDYKPTKSSEKDETKKADKFNAVCIFTNKLSVLIIGSYFIIFILLFICK